MPGKLTLRNDGDFPSIQLYGLIGDDWDGVTSKMFDAMVDALKAKGPLPVLGVRINSMGGSVPEGFAIYNCLKNCGAKVIVDVVGFACSAASSTAMAGDQIRVHENSLMMIHKPMNFVFGNATEIRKEADTLDKVQSAIAGVYASRSGKPLDECSSLMDAETWFTAQEACDYGLATELVKNAGPGMSTISPEQNDPSENPDDDSSMNVLCRKVLISRFHNMPAPVAKLLSVAPPTPAETGQWRLNLARRRLQLRERE